MTTPIEDLEERAKATLDLWIEAGRRLRELITPAVLTDERRDAFGAAIAEFERARAGFHESLAELEKRLGAARGQG